METNNNNRQNAIDVEFEEINKGSADREYKYEAAANSSSQDKQSGESNTATAALVLGIAGVVSAFTGKFAIIGLICSIIGLVLSSKERTSNPSGTVTAAFVLSIIGIAAAAIGLIIFIFVLAGSIALFSIF